LAAVVVVGVLMVLVVVALVDLGREQGYRLLPGRLTQ
jgi:hypothetical protein